MDNMQDQSDNESHNTNLFQSGDDVIARFLSQSACYLGLSEKVIGQQYLDNNEKPDSFSTISS